MTNVTTIYSEDSTPCDTEPKIKDVLPQIYIDLDFDHFSPSQLKQPFHYWLTNYFLLDPEIKKKKKHHLWLGRVQPYTNYFRILI